MKRLMTIAVTATMLLAACSKDDLDANRSMAVQIDPTIADPALFPKASTRVTDTDFENGDKIGVTITMTADNSAFFTNKEFTFDGTNFTAPSTLWYEDVNATSSIFAYHPYQAGSSIPTEFSVLSDQNGANYAKSDLIIGVKTGVKPEKKVDVTFKHKMTRLIIRVTNGTESDVTEILIKGAVGTGTIDATTGVFAAKADAATIDVKACEQTKNQLYYALLVPQNAVKLETSVTTSDGKTRTYTLATTDLVSGTNRELKMNIMPKDMEVILGGVIENWADGGEIEIDSSGESEEPTTPTITWGGVDYKIVELEDGHTWMAENLRYVPDGKTVSSDPADNNGIWYPCGIDKAANPDLVDKYGLIYSYPVLLGMTEGLSDNNYDKFEGVQGICPDGWHIPTKAEWLKLAGQGSGNLKDETSPYFEAAQQGAPIVALNADGFNMSGCGYINAGNATAKPVYMANASAADATAYGMGYFASSSAYQVTYNTTGDPTSGVKNIQYYAAMVTYNANFNRMQVAFQGAYGGAPVRCIKDAE